MTAWKGADVRQLLAGLLYAVGAVLMLPGLLLVRLGFLCEGPGAAHAMKHRILRRWFP